MPRDLTELIRNLSPGALRLFKQQLATLPQRERQLAFKSLAGVPELSDIIGRPTPMPQQARVEQPQAPAPEQQRPDLGQIMASPDVPLWQKGLAGFAAPFQWVHEKAIEPFAATVTAPFTPTTPETAGLTGLERHLAEYKGWEAPWGVKGAVELLPWLAIPGIGTVAGKAGMVAGRGIAGALGRLGPAGRVAGTALEYSPWGLAEKAAGKAIGAVAKPITARAARFLPRVGPGAKTLEEISFSAPASEIIEKEITKLDWQNHWPLSPIMPSGTWQLHSITSIHRSEHLVKSFFRFFAAVSSFKIECYEILLMIPYRIVQ